MSMPIRLLFLTDTYLGGYAGSEKYLEKLGMGLNPDIFRIKVMQLANKSIPHPAGELSGRKEVKLEQIRMDAAYSKVGREVRARLHRDFAEKRYDIIHSLHEKSDLLSAIAGGSIVRVSGRRDIGFKKGIVLRTLFKFLNNRFDKFVVPAKAIADGLAATESVAPDRIEVIPNGLDLHKFRGADGAAARQELGLAHGQFVIGCIANLNSVKRHDLILTAFSRIVSEVGDARLIFVGKGDLEGRLRQQADEIGIAERVLFLGQRSDIPALLACMDVVVSASDSEGMSNALIESAAAGVPAIATDVGGSPEIVDEGRTGMLVPAGDPGAIAAAILELYRRPDLRALMSSCAAKKASSIWSLDAMIASHEALYQSLADQNPARRGQGK